MERLREILMELTIKMLYKDTQILGAVFGDKDSKCNNEVYYLFHTI